MAVSLPCSRQDLPLMLFYFADHFHTNTQRREASCVLCSSESNSSGFQVGTGRGETKLKKTHTLLLLLNERPRHDISTVTTGLLGLHQLNTPCTAQFSHLLLSPLLGPKDTGFILQQIHRRWVSALRLTDRETTKPERPFLPNKPSLFTCIFLVWGWWKRQAPTHRSGENQTLMTLMLTSTMSFLCPYSNYCADGPQETSATTSLEEPGAWSSCGVRTGSHCKGKQRSADS